MRYLAAMSLIAVCASVVTAADRTPMLMEITLGGQHIEGTPLVWSSSLVQLLGRDGRLWEFEPDAAQRVRKTKARFSSYTSGQIRAELSREFGRSFDVSSTGHYLVVHPSGQRDLWGPRFEEMYRSFVHYFSVRGFDLNKPQFPLVAVVLPDEPDFMRYASGQGDDLQSGVVGYYSPVTNRVALYDMGGGTETQARLEETTATVIHEAAHQVAFNCGVHNRFGTPPRWLCEGLGTLFEAPGVANARRVRDPKARINRDRLADFKHYAKHDREPVTIAELVSSDRMFFSKPTAAYAESWAFTYFLTETRPRDYSKYVKLTARRPSFSMYSSAERVADFASVFGDDFRMIEAKFLQFMRNVD